MPETISQSVRVECHSCGAKFKAPAKMAGKKGPCPKCKTILTVPQPEPVAEGEVDWSMLADAAASAPAVETDGYGVVDVEPEPRLARQPARQGNVLASLTPEQRAGLAKRAEERANQSRFRKVSDGDDNLWGFPSFPGGVGLALLGAALGAGLWFLLLAGTGRELRFMAIVVGTLAGGGMFMGYQKHDVGAGALAACLAVAAIVFAKFAVVWWGTSYLIAAQERIEISEAEKQIDEYYSRSPDPDLMASDGFNWLLMEYMVDENVTSEQIYGGLDWQRDRHLFPIYDKREAASYDELLLMHQRWTLYNEQLASRTEELVAQWKRDNPAPEPADDEAAAEGGEDEEGEFEYDTKKFEWEMAAHAAVSEKAKVEVFAEVREMEPGTVAADYDAWREQQRVEEKLALRATGVELREQFEELADDPDIIAAQQEHAKFLVFGGSDFILIPLALGAAFKIGTGFGD